MRFLKFLLFVVIPLLVILRLALPYALKSYAEYKLNQIPEYRAQIETINVNLYRGSYSIIKLKLIKVNKNIPVPFFSADIIDLSVDWKALLHGAFVAKVITVNPSLNFVVDDNKNKQQLSISDQWRVAAKALFPLNFNKVTVQNGALHFRSFTGKPPFDLFLKEINGTLDNLRNVTKDKNLLSSTLKVHGKGMDGSHVSLDMRMNPFASRPTFHMEGSIENMRMREANAFLQHYTKIKVAQGSFSLYVEVAAAKGRIAGYAKPLIKNLRVADPAKSSSSPIEALYKGAVQVVVKVLENRHKTVATKVIIKGNIENPDTSLWSIIGYILRNAFIQALLPQIDHSVDMQDVEVK